MIARLVLSICLACTALPVAAFAQGPQIPSFWDSRERVERPQLGELPRLRFLTTVDFPPFNHLDASGQLAGFHVDLAKAICSELELDAICQIQALPWDELAPAIEAGEGEAILAGLAATPELRERFAFTRPYLKFPARFLGLRSAKFTEPLYAALATKRVGVLAGSTHEAMLRAQFPDAQPVTYARQSWMLRDLKDGKVDAVFSDGMRLAFWLAGDEPEECCAFVGGPYLAPDYLGNGLTIAVDKDNPQLAEALDYALREIDVSGRFAELYLRYFPISFY